MDQRNGSNDVYLIEDPADTITKTQITDVSTTSFYASQTITAGGVGGIMLNDKRASDHYNIGIGVDWAMTRNSR